MELFELITIQFLFHNDCVLTAAYYAPWKYSLVIFAFSFVPFVETRGWARVCGSSRLERSQSRVRNMKRVQIDGQSTVYEIHGTSGNFEEIPLVITFAALYL